MVLLLGFFSQGLFGLRLLIQLWHTEKHKTTQAPLLYWYASLWAALFYLLYGVIRQDVVIIIGQVITYFIYIRNIQLQGRWNSVPVLLRLFYVIMPV
ncbi:MAG: lipid-A-disaccharide synthase N-terminal domain-containing protein, partial [Cyclobacteriaceae bacterium]|nr:lipid-A-disaccharide synthase N-terminal domain-containing protein [Cyclobacteriaceae bacterium]